MVEITYGRIGANGRRLRYAVSDEAEARRLVQMSLRRRAMAKRRIGVPYRVRELLDAWQWLSLTAEESIPRLARSATAA